MNTWHALLLGIIQGLTEFLPVSSTAHLLLAQRILGLPPGDLIFGFLVIIQLGTVLALVLVFWKDLLSIARATIDFRTPTPERRLGLLIVLATVPAAIMGYLLRHAVEALFQSPEVEAVIRFFAAAFLLVAAERLGKQNRGLNELSWQDALVIGLFQVVAVFPGASRSGSTISGAMLRGLDRTSAARFAFLMAIPILLGAGGYQLFDVMGLPGLREMIPALLIGFAAAAVSGWIAVRWLLKYLGNHSLYGFAAYCALVGFVVLVAYVV